MGKYFVTGGRALKGEIDIKGGKNVVLPVLAATILNKDISIIENCPDISDVAITIEILRKIGCKVTKDGSTIIVDSKDANKNYVEAETGHKMRSSIIFFGSILGRFKEGKVPYPGGCRIGARPIDLHLKAFRKMGVEVYEENEEINFKAEKIQGTEINLDYPSVGATENIMLAAVLAKGTTTIYNCAREPEIEGLQEFLNSMGAKIKGAGTDIIVIEGVEKLHSAHYKAIPDRIEAGTYMIGAAITGGEIYIKNAKKDIMIQTVMRLCEAGCYVKTDKNGILVKAPKKIKNIGLVKTMPYPGFPTDMQPQMMALLTLARGTSIIIETVFEGRFNHITELNKMGADITFSGNTAIINGVNSLKGANVSATDLRNGAALILAGLAAEGETVVNNSHYVERGYEHIEKCLSSVGGQIIFSEV